MGNDIRTAALAALLGSLGAAFAQQAQHQPPKEPSPKDEPIDRLNQPGEEKSGKHRLPAFSQLDTDGDGSLTEAEVREHLDLAELFSELDSDSNGRISMREYAQAKVRLEK